MNRIFKAIARSGWVGMRQPVLTVQRLPQPCLSQRYLDHNKFYSASLYSRKQHHQIAFYILLFGVALLLSLVAHDHSFYFFFATWYPQNTRRLKALGLSLQRMFQPLDQLWPESMDSPEQFNRFMAKLKIKDSRGEQKEASQRQLQLEMAGADRLVKKVDAIFKKAEEQTR